MNKKLLYTLIIMPFLIIGFYKTSYSHKNDAPAHQTGASGEQSCGFNGTNSCHSSTSCGGDNSVLTQLNLDILLTANGNTVDANFEYTADEVYDMIFKILNPADRNGFSLSAKDDSNSDIGTLSDAGANTELNPSDNNYVGHTTSVGVSEWTFKWTAPATGSGNVTFFASANKAGGVSPMITPCGDSIIPFKMTIAEKIVEDTTISINDISLKEDVSILGNPLINNTLNIEVEVKEPKTYFISIYDMTGKIIKNQEQFFHNGTKTIEINLKEKGLFLLNISTNKNEIATYKIIN